MAKAADRRAIEWLNCTGDAGYFAWHYAIIDEPQGSDLATVPFHLWPAQVALLWQLMLQRKVIILKARQLGISWLCCLYALWLCFFQSGKTVLIFSKGQDEANELIRRIRVMYERLPEWMIRAGPTLTINNTSELSWSNGSRCKSQPATENAGRSFTASTVIMDEFAFMRWAEQLYNSAKATVNDGGQIIVFSTANGAGNLFQKLWDNALKRQNDFAAFFLNWQCRPGRTVEWREKAIADAPTVALGEQEYPTSADDAFRSSNAEKFLANILWWDSCQESGIAALDKKTPCVVGMDAGTHNDHFGLVIVTRHPLRKAEIAVRYVKEWIPRDGPLNFIGTPDNPGPELMLRLLKDNYNVQCVCYDPYQLFYLAQKMEMELGVWFAAFNQGAERYESDKSLYDLIINKRIWHSGEAALRTHIDNADRKADAELRKFRMVKREDSGKIDLAVALAMASHTCLRLDL